MLTIQRTILRIGLILRDNYFSSVINEAKMCLLMVVCKHINISVF